MKKFSIILTILMSVFLLTNVSAKMLPTRGDYEVTVAKLFMVIQVNETKETYDNTNGLEGFIYELSGIPRHDRTVELTNFLTDVYAYHSHGATTQIIIDNEDGSSGIAIAKKFNSNRQSLEKTLSISGTNYGQVKGIWWGIFGRFLIWLGNEMLEW